MIRPRQEIDGVIFDFGGVLTTSPVGAIAASAAEVGLSLQQVAPIILGPMDTDGDHPWHRVERGEVDLETYDELLEPVWRAEGFTVFPSPPRHLPPGIEAQPAMIDAVRKIGAAGYRTAILTNNIAEWSTWRRLIDADSLVDVIVDSCQVGQRKPNQAIYHLTLERLGGLDASRCVFLDDFAGNIAGAEQVGLRTMHVRDAETSAAELLTFLALD